MDGQYFLPNALTAERREKGVKVLHTHLGGSFPLERLWELGRNRSIRGVGPQRAFMRAMGLRSANTGNLDTYLSPFDLAERIQAGPQALFKCARAAVANEDRTAGIIEPHYGEDGSIPVFHLSGLELRRTR